MQGVVIREQAKVQGQMRIEGCLLMLCSPGRFYIHRLISRP